MAMHTPNSNEVHHQLVKNSLLDPDMNIHIIRPAVGNLTSGGSITVYKNMNHYTMWHRPQSCHDAVKVRSMKILCINGSSNDTAPFIPLLYSIGAQLAEHVGYAKPKRPPPNGLNVMMNLPYGGDIPQRHKHTLYMVKRIQASGLGIQAEMLSNVWYTANRSTKNITSGGGLEGSRY